MSEHHSAHPFTEEELVRIRMVDKTAQFEGHHHHHHHHKVPEYKRPAAITTPLGLFALKKLTAMNPDILSFKEKRLLKAAEPGVLTHLGYGALLLTFPFYVIPVYRNFGLKAFLRPQVGAPLVGLIAATIAFQPLANYCRESLWSVPRRKLVEKYKDRWGEEYLLDVLNPTFRLPEAA